MLQPLEEKTAAAGLEETVASASAGAGGPGDAAAAKKRKRGSGAGQGAGQGGGGMGKELTPEQKAVAKMNVTRESTDGVVKCVYCDKEISSKNVDRWASHLRGCIKTPEEVKAQIQPFRLAGSSSAMTGAMGAASGVRAIAHVPTMGMVPGAVPGAVSVSVPPAMATPSAVQVGALAAPFSSGPFSEVFKVHVSKDYMKFNAAHFIAYKGFREKLHGHNYQLAVTITGVVGHDGYVVDFGEIKKISRVICKDLNESFLVPMKSDALKITFDSTNVHIQTEDMAKFSFPKADCSLLPIVHSSAEELAIYISNQLVDAFTMVALLERGARKIEVSIAEASQQFASYERTLFG